jgi:putative ABC transport system permease protein
MARRKVRTGLTMFGIAIGVFALTVMGAMSENFSVQIDNAFNLYRQVIQINQAKSGGDGRITPVDVAHINQVDGVLGTVNIIGGPLADTGDSGISLGPPESVYGVDPYFIEYVFGTVPLQAGRWLDESDERATVVGSKIARSHNLGIGSTLTWKDHDYTVVGIMGDTNSFPDEYALMPFDTVRRDLKMPISVIGDIQVVTQPSADPEVVAHEIEKEVPNVKALSPKQEMAQISQTMVVFNVIVLGGALLAAVVGGLAVVNTMIMSVNERTREIGIKKALGAENSTIVREYLSEAALIGLFGGAAGLWFGWVVTVLLNVVVAGSQGGSDVWQVTPRLIVLVIGFAFALGLVAGVYPAWSAARLDPVQALRAE